MTSFEEGDMDPGAAAAYATGGDDAGAGGGGVGSLESSGPLDRLFDGDAPGPPVAQIQTDYGFSKHWAVFTRGAVRTATGSGIPPIVELVIGAGLGIVNAAQGGDRPALDDGVAVDVDE